jgi:hypothetical protein
VSAFISASATGFPLIVPSDLRHVDDEWTRNDDVQPAPEGSLHCTVSDFLDIADYTTGWWPNSGGMVQDTGLSDVRGQFESPSQRIWPIAGAANGRLSFVGVTRDQYGSAIGGCTVRCFRVSTNELTSQVISDASTGAFTITTPYNDAHFLTVHLTSTPNIAGATVDTLIAS